jgi:hypothetical protein
MEIETFYKYNKDEPITVITNFFEYPHLADIKISRKNEELVVLLRLPHTEYFLNHRQLEMQQAAEEHWKRRGCSIFVLKSQKDIERFVSGKIKQETKSLG